MQLAAGTIVSKRKSLIEVAVVFLKQSRSIEEEDIDIWAQEATHSVASYDDFDCAKTSDILQKETSSQQECKHLITQTQYP